MLAEINPSILYVLFFDVALFGLIRTWIIETNIFKSRNTRFMTRVKKIDLASIGQEAKTQ